MSAEPSQMLPQLTPDDESTTGNGGFGNDGQSSEYISPLFDSDGSAYEQPGDSEFLSAKQEEEEDDDDDDDYEYEDENYEVGPSGTQRGHDSESEDNDVPDEQDDDTPARYRGPSYNWSKWTWQERREADSLDAIRARDLSVHLYNAFVLKKRADESKKKIKASRELPDQSEDSRTEGTKNTDGKQSLPFAPPKSWTAWPMPPDIVPRIDEYGPQDEDERWTVRGLQDERTSADLESCLIACMLKTAKEKFESREWAREGSRHPSISVRATPRTDYGSDDEGEELGERRSSELVGVGSNAVLRPVLQADDEMAEETLRPMGRNILEKLDDLLRALHQARLVHVEGTTLSSDSENDEKHTATRMQQTMSDDGELGNTEGSQSRVSKRVRNHSAATGTRRNGDGNDDSSANSADQTNSPSPKRRKTAPSTNARGRLPYTKGTSAYLRDWSEVVGVASMTGWPASAVMRTSQRCADLFGQDMEFRTFSEGQLELDESDSKPKWQYTEAYSADSQLTDTEKHKNISRSRSRSKSRKRNEQSESKHDIVSHVSGGYAVYCPIKECPRSTKGFSRTWNMHLHFKKKHPHIQLETLADTA